MKLEMTIVVLLSAELTFSQALNHCFLQKGDIKQK